MLAFNNAQLTRYGAPNGNSALGILEQTAIGLFVTEEATLGQAAETAGLSQADSLRELGGRRIPIHYGPEELASDLKTVEALAGR
jgi:predicted HTH domain antitoxin